MTKYFLGFVAALCLCSEVFALDKYTFDRSHSFVGFSINHFGYSNPEGKWYVEGDLQLDEKNPKDSKVNVTIDVANLITGIPKLDEHLKGADFFDVAKYPTATFVSDKVTVTGKDTAKVQGMLTLRGVTKPVTLNVKLNKAAVNPMNNKMTAGFSATTTLKRSQFGMDAYTPGLGDEVKLTIEVEANKV